ncbi:hypothetical protein HDV62DRAFT_153176 [Trichoderma sp. SZMC 28011]
MAPSDGRCDGPLRHVPVPGCLALLAQHGDIPCPSNVASSAREPTPGRVANPQFGLTAKGCLACSCPDPPTLPLARTRPRGPGHGGQRWQGKGTRTLAWMYRLAERYLVRTGDCAQHCPSTSRRCSVKCTLPSPSTVTNWQRSVPHPELVLVHSEPWLYRYSLARPRPRWSAPLNRQKQNRPQPGLATVFLLLFLLSSRLHRPPHFFLLFPCGSVSETERPGPSQPTEREREKVKGKKRKKEKREKKRETLPTTAFSLYIFSLVRITLLSCLPRSSSLLFLFSSCASSPRLFFSLIRHSTQLIGLHCSSG